MNNNPPEIFEKAKNIWGTLIQNKAPENFKLDLQLHLYKKLLNIFQPGSYYHMVFNVPNSELEMISTDITTVLGYEPQEVTAAFFLDKIHPGDKPYFLKFEQKWAEFYSLLPFEKISHYKYQHDYRIQHKNGSYVRLLHQIVPIEYDRKNYYRSLVLHTDITHIKPDGTPCFSIIGFDGEPSYLNIDIAMPLLPSGNLFSRREQQILKLIVEGKNSRQIAEDLCISLHTVSTHRKNLLGKSNCKTPVELVSRAIQEGWI